MLEKQIVLASNVKDSRNVSTSHFYNNLALPLQLDDGEWYVGVRKIIYRNSNLNVLNSWLDIEVQTANILYTAGLFGYYKSSEVNLLVSPFHEPEDHSAIMLSFNQRTDMGKTNFHSVLILWREGEEFKTFELPYEAGMTDKQFNFPKGSFFINTLKAEMPEHHSISDIKIAVKYWKSYRVTLRTAHYFSFSRFLHEVNLEINSIVNTGHDIFRYDAEKKRTLIVLEDSERINSISLNDELRDILGFKRAYHTTPIKATFSENEPNLFGNRFPLCVTTNIINPIQIGDLHLPVLEMFLLSSFSKGEGEVVEHSVHSPLFHPVIKTCSNTIEEIEIKICNDRGTIVNFDNSEGNAKTIIVLTFIKSPI